MSKLEAVSGAVNVIMNRIQKKSKAPAKKGEASEDGDFVALREMREQWYKSGVDENEKVRMYADYICHVDFEEPQERNRHKNAEADTLEDVRLFVEYHKTGSGSRMDNRHKNSEVDDEEDLHMYIEYHMMGDGSSQENNSRRGHHEDLEIIPELSDVLEGAPDIKGEGRPTSAQGTRLKRPGTAGTASFWETLTNAADGSSTDFREALNKVTAGHSLTEPRCLDPLTSQNILHYVIENDRQEALNILLEKVDEAVIQQSYDLTVNKTPGKMTALHIAVQKNNIELLKTLLSKVSHLTARKQLLLMEAPIDIQGQRPRTFTCLHLAAYHGFTDIVLYLIEVQGIDVNHPNAKTDTALLWAARWGHQDTVAALLKKGANTDVENDKGSTALYWAVRYGHTETVKLLASEGKADVNQTRKLGFVAPIVLASALGYTEIVKILLDHKADPNFEIRGGERPIHQAGREGHTEVAKLLLSAGAIMDASDERGDTALLLAAKHGKAATLHFLLREGANVSHKNHMGVDVWTLAISNKSDLIIKLLVIHERSLEHKTEVQSGSGTVSSGVNALLFMAASTGNCERIQLLHKLKIDTKAVDNNGNNFLHYAAIENQPSVIERFHKLADVNARNKAGNTPLHEACKLGNHEVVMELINVKAIANVVNELDETALHVAAYCETIQPITVAKLIDYVIKSHPWESLNICDKNGNNALHIAAKHARPDVLWEFRFVRFKDPNGDYNLPLHESVREGEPECLEMMLDIYDAMKRDCPINWQNEYDETTLYLAAKQGFLEGVKRLVLFGADISLANYEGDTPLHLLTTLTVSDPSHCSRYLEVMDAIFERAPQWYCTKNNIPPQYEPKYIRRHAILELVTEYFNTEELSVIALSCKVGASEVLNKLYSLQDVFIFAEKGYRRYDITFLTPKTNGSSKNRKVGNQVSPVNARSSCVEWLLATGTDSPHNAAKVLDTPPFVHIEGSYGSIAASAYAIIMFVHMVYMAVHSWSGVALLEKARKYPGDHSIDAPTVCLYAVVPLEPAFIVFYHLYTFWKIVRMGELSVKTNVNIRSTMTIMYNVLTVLVSLIHCLFVVMWIGVYSQDYDFKDSILAISLCIGWLYTISFTRGLKVINYFWRLIQIMIVKDVLKFVVVYLFVLLAFGFAFHAQFQVSQAVVDEYPSPTNTLFMMFNMMIGMDYVFEDGTVEAGIRAAGNSDVPLKLYFIVYMVMGTIVLLNLLIAMMNDSYQSILQKQSMLWRIESVKLGVEIERSIPLTFRLFSNVRVIEGFICPSDEDHDRKRWYIDIAVQRKTEREKFKDEGETEALFELKTKIEGVDVRVTEQLQQLKTCLEDLQTSFRAIEQSLGLESRPSQSIAARRTSVVKL